MSLAAAGQTAKTRSAETPSTVSSSVTSAIRKRFNGDGHLGSDPTGARFFSAEDAVDAAPAQCAKQEQFDQLLCNASTSELKKVRVEVHDGLVCLHGRVSSFYVKQLAQETLRPYAIGLKIDNHLVVDLP